MIRILSTALLATALSFAAQAQDKDSQGGTATDAGFYKNASAAGVTEVAASEIALKQSTSKAVKSFAQKMVTDHTKANDELKELKSGDKGYSIAHEPTPEGSKMIDALSRLNGADFNREYRKMMIADHEEAVAMFEVEIEKGSSPELKAFAKKTLPTLKHHLQEAKALPQK
ncbi:DUF4142 domain-containing protein [Luteibacter sp. 3190]|uniref:DUF4142 domain-containing protein n=1 Tax=Luteibacter sp. 3190 TaxID=2817736 RepID=UPI00285A28EA|nr:DUF4142 domain-containing protein [Luteibacter sp. 3190]MDR6937042.1 putative membrane protein [Luteibacter sp. 3190]